ncbi:MAG: ABC transporter permease [Candidatus Promineifilaceae bacterium]|nr:ABC transporter permease [Candidatus Promineifilaceae bacterium]
MIRANSLDRNEERMSGRAAVWSAFGAMVRKEFIIMLRYPVEFIASFFQVFVIIIVLTFAALMFAPEGVGSEASATTGGLVAYGMIVFLYLSDTLWAIGFNVRREQKQGTLEQLYLSPASKFASLAARVTITLVWTGLLSATSLVVMGALLGRLPFANGPLGLYILLMTLAGTFGSGFAFAALTLRIKEAAQTAVNLLQFGFMVLCAPFFPFSALPPAVLAVARLIPLSYGVDAFRSTLMGYPAGFPELAPIEIELIIVTLFGLLMPFVGYWLYRRAENDARQRGSLAEY